jgi:hypothetical protein
MRSFDFIGSFETFDASIEKLSSLMGLALDMDVRLNETTGEKPIVPCTAEYYKVRAKLEDILIEDMRFFDKVMSMRLGT